MGFRDEFPQFEARDVQVIGASADSPAANEKFRQKYDLPFPLLCDDADKTLCRAFGAWQLKKRFGKESYGIVRSSFLIGPDGTIEKVWPEVKAGEHPGEVLAALG